MILQAGEKICKTVVVVCYLKKIPVQESQYKNHRTRISVQEAQYKIDKNNLILRNLQTLWFSWRKFVGFLQKGCFSSF